MRVNIRAKGQLESECGVNLGLTPDLHRIGTGFRNSVGSEYQVFEGKLTPNMA